MKVIIGIDNGITGSLGFAYDNGSLAWMKTPVKKTLKYTKKKGFINIINLKPFKDALKLHQKDCVMILVERPMVNPVRFNATLSAMRCFETTEQTIMELEMPYVFIDSKEWQKTMLPSGLKGDKELKEASDAVCKRYLPTKKFAKGNGDGLLIAIHGRQKYMGYNNKENKC